MQRIQYKSEEAIAWKVGASTFIADPERGARLMAWSIDVAGQARDVIRWPEESPLNFAGTRGGNPVLFPFSARTFNKGQLNEWKTPEGEIREMPMHGFARDSDFQICEITETGFSAFIGSNEITRKYYPYEFEFSVTYRFTETSLTVDFELENQDQKAIPWSAGHHFYFNLPWIENTERKDYWIDIPAKKSFYKDSKGQLIQQAYKGGRFNLSDETALDRIQTNLTSNIIRFGSNDEQSIIEVKIGNNERPPAAYTLVTWAENTEVPYYCVEPWMGPPNSPEHKKGLHFVNPGETEKFSVEISLA